MFRAKPAMDALSRLAHNLEQAAHAAGDVLKDPVAEVDYVENAGTALQLIESLGHVCSAATSAPVSPRRTNRGDPAVQLAKAREDLRAKVGMIMFDI